MKVLDKGSIELINHMGDDNTVVSAARVSHLGESKGFQKDQQLIRYLMNNHHTSPFEQVELQFLVKCPIFVARQWMRHRTWSYNEVSRRYTSEEIEFHIPDIMRTQTLEDKQSSKDINFSTPEVKLVFNLAMRMAIEKQTEKAYSTYNYLLSMGIAREQARMVLPSNLYTKFYAKTDLHNLFHFLELRNSEHAQKEIKEYAVAIEEIIQPLFPMSFDAWKNKK